MLAANPLATLLSPRLVTGRNRLRDVFLDPAEQALYPDWEAAGAALVAGFRESVGTDTDDPRFIELVGELSLAIYHAEPGTTNADKLSLLASCLPRTPVAASAQTGVVSSDRRSHR